MSLYRRIFKKSRHLGLESISYLVHGSSYLRRCQIELGHYLSLIIVPLLAAGRSAEPPNNSSSSLRRWKCGAIFASYGGRMKHERAQHSENPYKLECGICGRPFRYPQRDGEYK